MPDPDLDCGSARHSFDWRGWLTLAWVLGTGTLYAQMVLETKAPRILEVLQAASGARPDEQRGEGPAEAGPPPRPILE